MSLDMERLLDSIRQTESGGNANAVSPKGAQGPYQLMPGTQKELGVKDPFNEAEARTGARRYITSLLSQNGNDLNHALAAWNWGPGNLAEKGIDNMPNETRGFISKVMANYGEAPAATPDHPMTRALLESINSNQQPSTLDVLFPGDKADYSAAAGNLFLVNHENDALTEAVLNPKPTDKARRIYDMQLRTGLPVGIIERNLDDIEQKTKQEGFNAEAFRRESPALAEWLAANPTRASMAQGDYENLSALEKTWSTLKAVPIGGELGLKTERSMMLGYKAVAGTITPQEELERNQLNTDMNSLQQQTMEGLPSWVSSAASYATMQIPMGLEAASKGVQYGLPLGMAVGAGLGMIGGPGAPVTVPAGMATFGVIGFKAAAASSYIDQTYQLSVGDAFSDLEHATSADGTPLDPTVARYASMLVAVPNAMLEFASLRTGVKLIPGAERVMGRLSTQGMKEILTRPTVMAAMKDFGKKYAVAVGTETFTEGMQKFMNIIGREMATGDMGSGLSKADAQAVVAESSAAFKGTVLLGALASGPKIVEIYAGIHKAAQNEQFMLDLGDIVKQSKMQKTSPEAMREYIAKLKANGPIQNVLVPVEQWNLLFQAKAPQAAAEVFGNLDQYAEAMATGGDLVIPIEDYASKLAGTQYHDQLIQNSRFNPWEMTPSEAEVAINAEDNIRENIKLETIDSIKTEAPLASIYTDVYDKVLKSGASTQEATRDATLWRERIRARAERLGVDPLALYNEQPLQVERNLPADMGKKLQAYNQQLAEPPQPFAQKLPLPEGNLNLPPVTAVEQSTAKEALAAAEESHKTYGVFGATFSPREGNMAGTDGVAVAGYPQRGVITEGAPTAAEIETFMRYNKGIFEKDKNAAVGLWLDNETGKGYMDITNVLPRDMAIAQGEHLGELAVWDLKNSEEIRLPVTTENSQQVLFQPAYHGTPHQFDKFSLEHLGRGEGTQAFGYGLYFTDKKAIAESYRASTTAQSNMPFNNIKVNGMTLRDYMQTLIPAMGDKVSMVRAGTYMAQIQMGKSWEELFTMVEADLQKAMYYDSNKDKQNMMRLVKFYDNVKKALTNLRSQKLDFGKENKGQLYKASIPEENTLLRWDEPINKQPQVVQDAITAGIGVRQNYLDGRDLYGELSRKFGSDKAASEFLNAHGVKGHKYFDGQSRAAGNGSYNYVIYDDNAIDILETYYQGERGASIPGKNFIALMKNADPSTFLHESAHLWLEELRTDAMRIDAPEQLKQDWATVRDWMGAKDNHISTDSHEAFAKGFEAYVMEGKSPSAQLREVFAQLKNWLLKIYKNMLALEVPLTPEVHDVMDRMLATDEAISYNREHNGYDKLLLDQNVMTSEEFKLYTDLNNNAKRTADDVFRAKVMREMRREQLDTWRKERDTLSNKVRKDVLEIPIYKAAYWLWSGKLPDGTEIEGVPSMKLDKVALLDMGVTLTDLPFRYQENGLHPDVVAELFGFPSGEAMVHDLIGLPTLKETIDGEVTRQMHQEHGDLMTDGSFMDKAGMEVQNTQQVDVFNFELRLLKRLGAKREMSHPAVLKDIARQIVGRKMLKDLDPRVYEAAAQKAAKEAEEAMLGYEFRQGTGRNLSVAFDAKQRQLLNVMLYKEASEKRFAADKAVRKWKAFLFRSDQRLAPHYNMDMVNAARAVAAAHGIGGTAESAASYMKTLATYDPQSYEDLKDMVELASGDGRPLGDLTVDDFAIVRDTVDGLWALARRSRQVEIDGQKLDRAVVTNELTSRINELIPDGKRPAGYAKAMTKWEETKIAMLGARAILRRVEHWVDAMDNGDPNGVFRKYVWQPVSEASDVYRDQRYKTLEKYKKIVEELPAGSLRLGKIDAKEIGYEFGSKTQLLGALMHTGNESNLTKLLLGRNWGVLGPDGMLDSQRWDTFIKRMQDTGVLTKHDYDFVQKVWDLLEELKPGAQAAHKEMYGFHFDEVSARPVATPFGNYRGGYYPAIVDTFMVEDAAIREAQNILASSPSSFLFPTTGRGFTKQRVAQYTKPLVLDLKLVPQHIDKVLRFTHIEPHIKDVGRIAIDKNFRSTLSMLDSEVATHMLVPWLQRTALQQIEAPGGVRMQGINKFFHYIKSNTGLQIMAGNVNVALQQVTGLSLAAVQVKPRYLAGGLWHLMENPTKTVKMIHDSSTFMRNRIATQTFDVQHAIDNILLDPSPYEKAKAFANKHGYFMQVWTQSFVDMVTWSGAYEQATSLGADERSAVRQADSAVRETQGTFAPEDISRFEAGPAYLRVFTMFYSYFNMAANLNATEFTKAFRQTGYAAGGRALYIYLTAFFLPAVIAEAITQATSGQIPDPEDDEDYLNTIASIVLGGQARMATAMVPIIGPSVQAGINMFNDKWYDDRISTSPAVSTLEATARVPLDLYRLATEDDPRLKRPVKDIFTLLGLATGLPIGPLARPITYLTEVGQGYAAGSDNPAETARGLITGKTRP